MIASVEMSEELEIDAIMDWMSSQTLKAFPKEPTFQSLMRYFNNGNRTVYEKIYFKRRKQLTYLGLVALRKKNDPVLIKKLEEGLFSICNEFSWCLPAHMDKDREFGDKKRYTLDLFACETAFTLVEIGELFKNELSKDLLNLIKTTVIDRVIDSFIEKNWTFEKLENNWSAVCAGSIGITSLYLLDDSDPQKRIILDRTTKAMTAFLKSYGEDGASLEGLSYWQYGFRYFTYYVDALNQSGYEKFANVLDVLKIKAIAAFQQNMYAYDKTIFNFSDAPETLEPAYDLAHYYHNKFPEEIRIPEPPMDKKLLVDHCGRWAPALRTLCWCQATAEKQKETKSINWFDDAQIMVYKDTDLQISVKGGTNHEPHNQNDLGHFMIYFQKSPFCIDLGAPVYTKDYFEDDRYNFIQASSLGHSVLTINGHSQSAHEDAEARVQRVDEKNLSMVLDLTSAYKVESLISYTREFKIVPNEKRLKIRDNVHFNKTENLISERFILNDFEDIVEMKDGIKVLYKQKCLCIQCYSPNTKVSLETLKYRDHFGKDKQAKIVSIIIDSKTISQTIDVDFSLKNLEEVSESFDL